MVLSRQISQQGKGVGSRNLLPRVSQTYPFLRFSGLNSSKRGGFEKPLFFQTTTFPGHFLQKGGLSFWAPLPNGSGVGPGQRVQGSSPTEAQFSQTYPFWGFQGWTFQKGVGLRNWWEKISQTHPFLRFSGLKAPKRRRFEKSSPASFFQKGIGWTLKKDRFEKSSSASFFTTLLRMSIWPSQISGIKIPTSANIFLFQRPNSYFSFELTKFDLTTCEL